jgi:hypothetical protein
MEIGANVNAAKEIRRFSEIPLGNSTDVQSQIVVCHSRNGNSAYDSTEEPCTPYNVRAEQDTRTGVSPFLLSWIKNQRMPETRDGQVLPY